MVVFLHLALPNSGHRFKSTPGPQTLRQEQAGPPTSSVRVVPSGSQKGYGFIDQYVYIIIYIYILDQYRSLTYKLYFQYHNIHVSYIYIPNISQRELYTHHLSMFIPNHLAHLAPLSPRHVRHRWANRLSPGVFPGTELCSIHSTLGSHPAGHP